MILGPYMQQFSKNLLIILVGFFDFVPFFSGFFAVCFVFLNLFGEFSIILFFFIFKRVIIVFGFLVFIHDKIAWNQFFFLLFCY